MFFVVDLSCAFCLSVVAYNMAIFCTVCFSTQCPLFWPLPGSTVCPTQGCTQFENITLRNINIFHPLISPGVIWGNSSNPIKNVVIEGLNVDENKYKIWHGKWPFHTKRYPWHGRIKCKFASGTYKDSNREPSCLVPAEE